MTSERRKTERVVRAEQRKEKRSQEWADRREREAREQRMSMSFHRKLDWASKHIEHLQVTQQAWLGTGAYSIVADTDPKTHRTVLRANITEPPPPDLSLIVGDAAHALRSALDHLALELAVTHHRPRSLPPAVEKASEFPVFQTKIGNELGRNAFHRVDKKTGKPARGSGLHKLQGTHPDAIKAIEGIQPYHRDTAYAEDPLWIIHELDRIDKHRRLNLTAYAVGGVGIGAGPDGNARFGNVTFEQMGHNGPVEHGTEVGIITASPDSHFGLNFTREISLAEPSLPNREFLIPALTTLRDYVRDVVVPLLEPWL